MENIYNISLLHQCRMLEAFLATNVVDQYLASPDNAPTITRSNKKFLSNLILNYYCPLQCHIPQ